MLTSFATISVQTALSILTNRTIGSLSILPFLSLFTNCVIWSFYGYLKNDYTVLVPNILGLFAGAFCTTAYWIYSAKSDLQFFLPSACILMIATVFFSTDEVNKLGTMGCCLAVIVMGSPLATLRTVIRDRSTSAMPFGISLATWLNAISWSLYGLLIADDVMVCSASFAFCLIQLMVVIVRSAINRSMDRI